MTDLATLIEYWENNYRLNYVQRSPTTNQNILDTISYLKELLSRKGDLL